MEYTLEDAHESLKDLYAELEKEEENLINTILNNKISTLNLSCTPKEVMLKQQKLAENLLKHIPEDKLKGCAVPNTSDLDVEILQEMEKEVEQMKHLLYKKQYELQKIEEDINYLNKKKNGLAKMQETYLVVAQTHATNTYDNEIAVARKLFYKVKCDLSTVVDAIFPNNDTLQNFLVALTHSYAKGGDDVYQDVQPEVLNCVQFLVEADIVTYHRNDKNKVKMSDML